MPEPAISSFRIQLFPKDFERYRFILTEDNKVFVTGRVSANDEENGKELLAIINKVERWVNNRENILTKRSINSFW